jgi:hypothetical protein
MFFSLHQHANGENAWVGIDGRSGDIVDMKERKVFLFIYRCKFDQCLFAWLTTLLSILDLGFLQR